jgi:hypothetical protein
LINLSFFKSIIYNGREGVKKNYVNQYQIQEKPALIFDSVVVSHKTKELYLWGVLIHIHPKQITIDLKYPLTQLQLLQNKYGYAEYEELCSAFHAK